MIKEFGPEGLREWWASNHGESRGSAPRPARVPSLPTLDPGVLVRYNQILYNVSGQVLDTIDTYFPSRIDTTTVTLLVLP